MQKIKVAVDDDPPLTGTLVIVPDQLVSSDTVQWLGQPPPGPGLRKCWACGYKWILEEGREDTCPRCGRPNVIKQVAPQKIEVVFRERDTSPQEEIERSRKILQQLRSPGETSLTVGDISVVTESKRERNLKWSMKPINNEPGVTVGDLFEGR